MPVDDRRRFLALELEEFGAVQAEKDGADGKDHRENPQPARRNQEGRQKDRQGAGEGGGCAEKVHRRDHQQNAQAGTDQVGHIESWHIPVVSEQEQCQGASPKR